MSNGVYGYNSDWHTDVIESQDSITVSVPNGNSSVDLVTHGLGYEPVYSAQYKAGSYWHQPGEYGRTGTTSGNDLNGVTAYMVPTTTKLTINFTNTGATRSVQVRYWLYQNQLTEAL